MNYLRHFYSDTFAFGAVLVVVILLLSLIGCAPEKYTEVEKHVIMQLQSKMHDPSSLEIMSITSVYMLDYEHFDKIPRDIRIVLLAMKPKNPKERFKIYSLKYRGKNAFGALRINAINAAAGRGRIKDFFCYFFDEEDLIEKSK